MSADDRIAPAGPRQRSRGVHRGGARRARGSGHADGEARIALFGCDPPAAAGFQLAHRRVPRVGGVCYAQGGGGAWLDRAGGGTQRVVARDQAGRSRSDFDLFRERHGAGFALIRDEWLGAAAGLGETIRIVLGQETVTGKFETIDKDGRLVLATPHGPRVIEAGDVLLGPRPVSTEMRA